MKSRFEPFFTIAGTEPQFTKLVFLWYILAFPRASNFITWLVNLRTSFLLFPLGRRISAKAY